jgi:hypothetical protein
MVWIALGLLLVMGVIWGFRRLARSTVYLSHPGGFVAHSFAKRQKLRPVPRDRYERILQRFVQGNLFDALWIAHHPKGDDEGGLTVSLEEDEVRMDVSFLALKEPDRLAAFRERMESWEYAPTSENPWNIGMGEDLESVTLEYRFERDLEKVRQVVERALETLEGPAGSEVFVHAWRSQDGPIGMGIKVVPDRDVLAEVP